MDSRFCPRCGTPAPGADTEELLASAASDPTGLLDRLRAATEGEFRIIRELGRGGMGRVYLAHEIALDRRVAMKVLPPAFAGHEGIVQRFQREARTAGKLSHPNIVPVFQVSKRDDLTFFTMPCVVGPNLRQVMRQTPQLRLELARRYLREAASALGYAHRQGVIHRDIKPENMLLEGSRDGRLLLTDFGIAKALGIGTTLTRPGDVMGTPYYMSPEQCEENEVDGRSDQYSLGLVAYEMLAGRFPFTADSLAAIIYKHLNEDPEPLQNFRADVPADLLAVIVRATQKDPDARFPTMAALIEALGAGAPTVRTTAARSTKPAPKPAAPLRSGRRGWITAGGIGLAALAAGAFALWQQRPSPSGLGDAQLAEINVPPAALVGVDTASETASEGSETEVPSEPDQPPPGEAERAAAAPSLGPSREEREQSREKLLSEVESGAQAAHQARAAALEAGADSLHPGEFDATSRDLRRAQQASRAGRPFVALRVYAQVTARFEELAGRARRDAE
ncbi:MAG: serine/threonine-protein kinase, partial [Gemmatimonadota bacterium]